MYIFPPTERYIWKIISITKFSLNNQWELLWYSLLQKITFQSRSYFTLCFLFFLSTEKFVYSRILVWELRLIFCLEKHWSDLPYHSLTRIKVVTHLWSLIFSEKLKIELNFHISIIHYNLRIRVMHPLILYDWIHLILQILLFSLTRYSWTQHKNSNFLKIRGYISLGNSLQKID